MASTKYSIATKDSEETMTGATTIQHFAKNPGSLERRETDEQYEG